MSQYGRVLGRVRRRPALEALSNTVLHNIALPRRRRGEAPTCRNALDAHVLAPTWRPDAAPTRRYRRATTSPVEL